MSKDKVFSKKQQAEDFKFGEKVVSVFDDMVTRSVPYYVEMQRMMGEQIKDFAQPNTNVYDLGCSTGTTLINVDQYLDDSVKFVGLDNSKEMLVKCESKFEEHGIKRDFELNYVDLNEGVRIENASVVVMCLTLQFVRPLYREQLVQSIYNQLNKDGCLIIIEKVLGESSLFNRLFIKYYYDYKRRKDYSDMEISQKREALENVLIPYKLEENKELLNKVGFRSHEVFFKWYNFSGLIALK